MDHNTIRAYETAFKQIQQVTGLKDINIIVDNFLHTEEENFALFNYVNELNSEVESLSEEMLAVGRDIERFEAEDLKVDTRHQGIMAQLEVLT